MSSSAVEPNNSAENGGDLLVSLLRHLGVEAAFGVVSVHNLPLVDALHRDLRWVPTRGEAGAVGAADGYARASANIGCAVTSTGTGAGNAAGALVEALTAATPLLHMTGQIDREYLGQDRGVIHETRDQLAMLAATSVWAATVGEHPQADLAEAVRRAFGSPSGPASLEWPIDGQFASARQATWDTRLAEPEDPDLTSLEEAVELIGKAERPLLWAGGGALGCSELVAELLDRTGAGLLTSNSGRGTLPESDGRVLGNFASTAAGAQLLEQADLLVSIGTHFRSNETRSYKLSIPARHVQIDIDPAALGRSYPCTVGIAGESSEVLAQLLEALPAVSAVATANETEWQNVLTRARAEMRTQLLADIGPYGPIVEAMNGVLGPDGIKVRDITIPNSAWGNRLLEITRPHTNIYPRGGGIGQALAMGIGASIARADVPTMVLMGDGGLQVQLGELSTLAEEQLPVTLVVFDDGGYGVLRNMQDAHLNRRSGVDLFTPRMADLASAHDMAYHSVTSADGFGPAFEAAVESSRPCMVHVDCEALGPMPKPFTPPVAIPTQP